MLPVSELERGPGCHPERSEGSGSSDAEILSEAKDDKHYLHMSNFWLEATKCVKYIPYPNTAYKTLLCS